jgi:hypothetical protein
MMATLQLASGRLELESVVRAPLVVIADPAVAASGPPATLDELAASVTGGSSLLAGCASGGGASLLERPGGTILAFANPLAGSGLFVWAARNFVAVVADPDDESLLDTVGELTVCSGRLVVGAPEVVAAWGPDVDTGDGSTARARMHRSRQRLGLIVVSLCPSGLATVATGVGAAAVAFSTGRVEPVPLPLAC